MRKIIFLIFIVFSICANAQVRVSFAYNYPTLPGTSQDSILNGLKSIRGCFFDPNLEGDNKSAIAVTNYHDQGRVHIFTCVGDDSLQLIWTSPKIVYNGGGSTPRYVLFGDLDNDGCKEVIFQSNYNGIYIFEHDGILGSHNFGIQPSQIINSLTLPQMTSVSGSCEFMEINNVDGDGKNELLVAYNSSPNDNDRYYVISAIGNWNTNDPGFSGFIAEFVGIRTQLGNYGLSGGSPYAMISGQLDGSGNREIILHNWNFKNVVPVRVPSANTYLLSDTLNGKQNLFLSNPYDDVSLFGGIAYDIDNDGRDEIYLPTYFLNGSSFAGFVHMISYAQGQSTSQIDTSNSFALNLNSIAPIPMYTFGFGYGDIDNDGKPNMYFSSEFPYNVISAEFQGGDKRNQNNWQISVLYPGDSTIYRSLTIKDSLGKIDTMNRVIDPSFVSKMFAKNTDVDKDGKEDIVLVYQALSDYIDIKKFIWNPFTGKYDSTNYQVINPKRWSLRILEAITSIIPPNITWNSNISISSGTQSNELTFGQAHSATDGIDPSLGELELPPVPPTGIFDARFELPITPTVGSLKDFRNDSLKSVGWLIKFQPGSAGYPMNFNWNPSALPIGTFFLKDIVTGTIVNVDMKTTSNYLLTNASITSLKIEYKKQICKDFSVSENWNIISVPVNASDMTKTGLFPTATSLAYGYNNGYIPADTLETSKGYWLKFDTSQNINICGDKVSVQTVPVMSGWNMIGGYDRDILVSSITSTPSGIILSQFYGYNNGYFIANTLNSGNGYWIKVSQNGMLNLPTSSTKNIKNLTQSEELDKVGKILIIDAKGNKAILYITNDKLGLSSYELPPIPPIEIFDIRFSSNRMVELLNNDEKVININSAVYPIKIRVEKISCRIKDKLTGKLVNEALNDGEELVIDNAGLNKFSIITTQLPMSYQLYQNFPNPFNPTTKIKFDLPENSNVSLQIYSILGELVEELVNKDMEAGYHQIKWNASNYSSGIYFYSFKAGKFQHVKKMILIK